MPLSNKQIGEKLQTQQDSAVEKMADDQKLLMSTYINKSTEEGGNVRSRLIVLFGDQAEEITKEIGREIDAIQAGHEQEMIDFQTDAALRRHSAALEGLMERYVLMHNVHGNEDSKIDTQGEAIALGTHGEIMLDAFDVSRALDETRVDFDQVERSINPDHLDIIRELENGNLDWDRVLPVLLPLMKGKGSQLDKCVGVQMLTYIKKPADRMEFMRKIANKPNGADIMMAMYRNNFVTQVQIDMVAEENNMLALREKIKDPKIAKHKLIIAKRTQPSKRIFGHRNIAQKNLTVKNVGGALVAANGALIIFANVAANAGTGDFGAAIVNPGNFFGAALLVGGMQASDGGGGLMPTPLEAGSKLARGKEVREKENLERKNAVIEGMKTDLANNKKYAKLYYKYADKIAGKYENKRKEGKASQGMTLDEMGIDSKGLAKLGLTPENTERQLNKWAKKFVDMGENISRPGADAQRSFIDETYEFYTGKTMESMISTT